MSYQSLLLDKGPDRVAYLTLNRPQNLNALGIELSRELKAALAECEGDPAVRAVVIRGAGRAFSSGGNVREMRESLEADPGRFMDELTAEVYSALEAVENMNKPTIASVHGLAYGAAMNLVMACDFAVAAADAVFCESFIRLGLIPGGHATILLTRIMGSRKALELCLTGREVKADEAVALGIVNLVVEPEELEQETQKLARGLAQGPPLAMQKTKQLFRAYYRNPPESQARLERETQILMGKSKDYAEGVRAFFEKRKPEFKGE